MKFNPHRLSLARRRRGLNKKTLASLIGVCPRTVVDYEREEGIDPSTEILSKIAKELDFPVEFFFAESLDEPCLDGVSFRAFSNLTAKYRDASLSASVIATSLNDWIESRYDLPAPRIPDLRGEEPEAAAEAVRIEWGLGNAAIKNLVHQLESNGVRIFSLPKDSQRLDAFCFWRTETPFIFLNTSKSSERSRFDAAHELAHLVLHRHGQIQGREVETEADRFASAFLMPKESVLSVAPSFITLETLIKMKRLWNVSVAALNHRIHTLKITSDWHYRQLCIQISERGFRKKEPLGGVHETSKILQIVLSDLRKEGISRSQIAKELHIYSNELNSYLFGLVISTLDGGGSSGRSRASLRLLDSMDSEASG
ncbi:MAG: ImmA/IrrE family metallo-endopeptidase [Bdellovibrionales bacterium]